MTDVTTAVVFTIVIWWLSTGILIALIRMSQSTIAWSLFSSSLLAIAALMGLAHTAHQTEVISAYCAFTCALLAWSWIELTFLTGWITGTRKCALAKDIQGWSRFIESLRAIIWHEIAIIVIGCAIVVITWDAPNQIGTWTFLVLWIMRTSAKLNLFFGVPNLSEKLLPAHLSYLESFFKRKRFNAFFPISVFAASFFYWLLISYSSNPLNNASQSVGAFLVSTLLALAIVEHLLLVLPIDSTALWKWALNQPIVHKEAALPPDLPMDTLLASSGAPIAPQLEKHDKPLQIY